MSKSQHVCALVLVSALLAQTSTLLMALRLAGVIIYDIYLGIYLKTHRVFRCCFDHAKRSFYKAFNAIFGKVGRVASEEVLYSYSKVNAYLFCIMAWTYVHRIVIRLGHCSLQSTAVLGRFSALDHKPWSMNVKHCLTAAHLWDHNNKDTYIFT